MAKPRKEDTEPEEDMLPAADTEQDHMAVAVDNQQLVADTLAAVDRTEVVYMAHRQGDNHSVVGSAIEDCLNSWNTAFDRS